MQKLRILLLALTLAGAINSNGLAQQKQSTAEDVKPGGVIVEVVRLTETVKGVDLQSKTAADL